MSAFIELLSWTVKLSVVIFVISSMLAMGMGQPVSEVIAPLRNLRATMTALGLNFIAAPLLAFLLARIIPLEPAHATGLLLLGGAAGAPFLPKLATTSGGGVSQSVAQMVLLMVATIVFIPVVMPFIVPGLQADPLKLAGPLAVLMLIPLCVGFALAQHGKDKITRFLAPVHSVSNIFFVLFLLSLTILQFRAMLEILGSFAIGTYLLFVIGLFGIGYFVSTGPSENRSVFGFGVAQRNVSAALVVAGASFDDPAITTMVLLSAVAGLLILMAMAKLIGRTR